MADLKTLPGDMDMAAFLDTVEPPRRREEARRLDAIFRKATGFAPLIWGEAIVGYGRYRYQYDSGRKGEYLATGFAPRKAHLVLYILPGFFGYGDLLDRLGRHRRGKSCLYFRSLADVQLPVLEQLVARSFAETRRRYPEAGRVG